MRNLCSVSRLPQSQSVLALQQQLVDLERFCTCEDEFTVAGFDPTFNCGKFSVTVMVYRNLLLESRKDGTIPTFLGPMLVHQRKLKESYHYLLSTLIGLRPSLSRILAIGTDGESNLATAALNNLPFAQHVRCAIHMTRDLQEKMKTEGVPKKYQGLFLRDVMGSFYSPDAKGLVDAESAEEFDEMLLNLSPIWEKREAEFSSRKPSFHAWFSKYHAKDVRSSMIVPIRESAGLGHPPAHFTTNTNESMNKVIKQALHYEERNWDKFCDDMLALVKVQYQELEKAVVRTGEYRFRPQFSCLEKPLAKWTSMSVEQRERHMRKEMCASMHSSPLADSDDQSVEDDSNASIHSTLSAPPNVPSERWERVVKKAHALATEPLLMSAVPGGNARSKYVVSSRNPDSPIKVQAGKCAGQYTCSKKKCPMFAGFDICGHVLAIAIRNGDSEALLKKCSRSAKEPNLQSVAMMEMPSNAGKKPNSRKWQPRKKKRSRDENDAPSSSGRKSPKLCKKKTSQTTSVSFPLSEHCLPSSTAPNPPSNVDLEPQPSPRINRSIPPPLLPQFTDSMQPQIKKATYLPQVPGPSNPNSLPPPLIPSAPQSLLPGTQIQINQQPTSCSRISMSVNQPSCSYSLPATNRPNQSTALQYSVSPQQHFTKPFFVKFLTKQIKICQGCRAGYQRDIEGNSLPPPYDIVIGHLERQQFCDRVTGLTRLSRETCVHYHVFLSCILAKHSSF